jgi:DNA-directed RNA polymerase specialized sigma24 family protein
MRSWVYSIAKSQALMFLRRERLRVKALYSEGAIVAKKDFRHERLDLEAVLGRLAVDGRDALLRHDLEGYRITDIAAQSGTTVTCTKSRVRRARGRLRHLLNPEYLGE